MFYYIDVSERIDFQQIYEIAISLVNQLFVFDSANLDRLSVELFCIPMVKIWLKLTIKMVQFNIYSGNGSHLVFKVCFLR